MTLYEKIKALGVSEILLNSSRYRDVLFAVGILSMVGLLIFPVPPILMDFLLCISIAIAVLIMMTVLFIEKPLDLNSFPTILLIVTILRLALNISTTRLILANGDSGIEAAGHVVKAFGYFVIQGSVIIGAVIFIILTIINFIVITKGSGRIAEVAARFSLDAMPGKQMAIDADLSAGLIKEDEAQRRRKNLEDESTFYGAMDGANKFVRGDAVAGLLITFINFVGGILIGVVQKDMSFSLAVHTYTILTIGDGLVTQIPALLVSVSAGMLVTKSGTHGSVDKAIFEQLGKYPNAMIVSAGLLLVMGVLMPGIPILPFFIVSTVAGGIAYWLWKIKQTKTKEDGANYGGVEGNQDKVSDAISVGDYSNNDQAIIQSLRVDSIKIELGYELLILLESEGSVKITEQIKALRKRIAVEMGFILPSVRIIDNMEINAREYVIRIKDVEYSRGEIMPNKLMIMNQVDNGFAIEGEDTTEPAFGLPARWVDSSAREEATFKGYTVIEPGTVIITHLAEIIKENITELLTYGAVKNLLDNLSPEHRRLMDEIVPSQISVVVIQRVLQGLLSEGVAIRDLGAILEAISEISAKTNNVIRLVEYVRVRLFRQLSRAYMSEGGYIPLIVLSPQWEQTFAESIMGEGDEKYLSLSPSKLNEFVTTVNKVFDTHLASGSSDIPVILTSHHLRYFVRSVIERFRPNLVVMSQNEIHPKAKIKTISYV